MNMVLYVVKYAAGVLAGVYGVYATLTDFREEKNGKKVLSRKGYAGITLLAISIVLSLSSDALKDYRERLDSIKQDAKREEMFNEQKRIGESVSAELGQSVEISRNLDSALKSLHKTSETVNRTATISAATLQESRRAVSPLAFSNLSTTFKVSISVEDKIVQDYLRQLPAPEPWKSVTYSESEVGFPKIDVGGIGRLNWFATHMYFAILIAKNPKNDRDLDLLAWCTDRGTPPPKRAVEIRWSASAKPSEFVVECETNFVDVRWDDGLIRSFVDLTGAKLSIAVLDTWGTWGTHELWSRDFDAQSFPSVVRIEGTLTTADGRNIKFGGVPGGGCLLENLRPCSTEILSEYSMETSR